MSLDGVGKEGCEELGGVVVKLLYLGAVVVEFVVRKCPDVSFVPISQHFQFSRDLSLDGFLEGFGELDDPVIWRNGRCGGCDLQVVSEVADVTVGCGPCASVAVW